MALPYSKRYAGGFHDLPTQDSAIDSTFLNAVETALNALLSTAPSANNVPVYDSVSGTFKPQLVTNAQVDAAAAIAYSKLTLAGSIVNADISAAAAIAASKLASYPSDGTKALFGDGTWKVPSSVTMYKANFDIVNTAAETNLISQSVAGNTLGANGAIYFVVEADYLNSTGGGVGLRIKVKLGATTLYDDAIASPNVTTSATHRKFVMWGLLANEGATNVQGLAGMIVLSTATAATTAGIGGWGGGVAGNQPYPYGGSSAIDTTSAATFAVTATHSTNSLNLELKWAVSALVIT